MYNIIDCDSLLCVDENLSLGAEFISFAFFATSAAEGVEFITALAASVDEPSLLKK